jgi:hypothetical protein
LVVALQHIFVISLLNILVWTSADGF